MRGVGVKFNHPLTVRLHVVGFIRAENFDEHGIGIVTIRIPPQQGGSRFRGVGLLPAFVMGFCQQGAHITAPGIFGKHALDFRDRLRVQLPFHIHLGKRAARHANARRRRIASSHIQSLQFALHGGVRGLGFKSALHVPDGIIEFILLIADDAHAHMRDKVARRAHEDARENIHSVAVFFHFEVRLAEQAVRVKMFWMRFQDVKTMSHYLVHLTAV